jgi:hypothetical protein
MDKYILIKCGVNDIRTNFKVSDDRCMIIEWLNQNGFYWNSSLSRFISKESQSVAYIIHKIGVLKLKND